MKILNIILGIGFVFIGVRTLIIGNISLKGNIVNLGYFTYPVSFILIGFGLFILYLSYKKKEIEF